MSVFIQRTRVPSSAHGRLLAAAADAFGDKGFHATTTRDISSRAGLSPAGVYVHFPSKEDLLFRLSDAGHRDAVELVTETIAEHHLPTDQLAAVVSRFSAWHARHYLTARVVQREFPALSPEHQRQLHRLRDQVDDAIQAVLVTGVRIGEFTVRNVVWARVALLSMIIDIARWYSPDEADPDDIGRAYAELALQLVGAGRSPSPAADDPSAPDRASGPATRRR